TRSKKNATIVRRPRSSSPQPCKIARRYRSAHSATRDVRRLRLGLWTTFKSDRKIFFADTVTAPCTASRYSVTELPQSAFRKCPVSRAVQVHAFFTRWQNRGSSVEWSEILIREH